MPTMKEPPKTRPDCPNCKKPTVMHCTENTNCDWWKCVGAECRTFGNDQHYVDPRGRHELGNA